MLGILLGQKIVPNNADALKLAAIIVTNILYEFFLMFLLAYAFVEFPRSLWNRSNLDGYLLKIQQKAAADFKHISDAQLTVSLVVSDVLKTKSQLSSYADQTLNHAMEILVAGTFWFDLCIPFTVAVGKKTFMLRLCVFVWS